MLTLLWALPAAGALAAAACGKRGAILAPLGALAALVLAVVVAPRAGSLTESAAWFHGAYGGLIGYRLGLSGLSLLLCLLTLLLTALCALAGLRRGPAFVAWLTALGAAATGMFLARDLVLFYVFWELMLIPTYFLLVGFGGAGRALAAWKFLLYNIGGSMALLLAVAALAVYRVGMPGLGVSAGGSSASVLATHPPAGVALPVAIALAIAFAVKTPLWPLHGWVADTYAELPAPAAALVGGVQSKAGLYGMLAILLPLLPGAMHALAPWLLAAGIVSALYGALCALRARQARHILAYSSIGHLGLVAVAFATLEPVALTGGVIALLAHGVFTAGLFLLLGMLEERLGGPVDVETLGGWARSAPGLAGALLLLGMAALGLPGLAGFPGELLMLVGIYAYSHILAILGGIALILAAAYMLRLLQLVLHGEARRVEAASDLRAAERWLLAPLGVLVLVIGLWPQPIPRAAARALHAVEQSAGPVAAAQGGSAQ